MKNAFLPYANVLLPVVIVASSFVFGLVCEKIVLRKLVRIALKTKLESDASSQDAKSLEQLYSELISLSERLAFIGFIFINGASGVYS